MSDTVWIVLIIGVVIVIALFLFRGNLSQFSFRANKEGLETDLKTRKKAPEAADATSPPEKYSVNISGNKQVGKDNEIVVARDDVNVSDNTQVGTDESIEVKADKDKKKKK